MIWNGIPLADGYNVTVSVNGVGVVQSVLVPRESTETISYTFNGLVPFTYLSSLGYETTVAAFNSNGTGPISAVYRTNLPSKFD